MTSMKDEINFFKIFYIIDMILVLTSFGIIWTNPSHTGMAQYYAWGELGIILCLIVDVIVTIELFDMATIEVGNPKYFLARWIRPEYLILGTIIVGLFAGAYYWNRVLYLHKIYIMIPNLFEAQPIGQIIDARTFEAFATSYPVSGEEDTFWFGILFPTLLGIIWLGLMKVVGDNELSDIASWICGFVLSALIVSYSFSYIGHNSAYAGNLVAFQDAFNYGLFCSTTVAFSGNILSCRIAHSIHNIAGVELKYEQHYSITQPSGFIQYPLT